MDYTTMTDEDLYTLIDGAKAELGKRQTKALVNEQVADILRTARESGAIETPTIGEEWEQPTDATNAYMKGDIVTHSGATWEATVDYCVWEPGISGWREQAGTDEDGNEIPAEYLPPTGAHDVYNTGDRVTFDGNVYEAVMDNVSWSPTEYPPAWEKQ